MTQPNSAPFETEASFRQAMDTVIAAATREIRIFDRDLARLALEQRTRAEALERFLADDRNRRLRIVLHDADHCERYCPRLNGLARRFSQAVEFRRSPDELRHLQECTVLADSTHAAIRFHVDHARGKIFIDAEEEVHPWWQRFGELWGQSTPCLSATRLGL